ncbi:hypothetical protein HD554DRAFT_2006658, partial [Boletus coccyginus]
LNETNYLTWHVCMHALLIHSDLWGVVSGTESTSDPSKAFVTKINTYIVYCVHGLSTQLAAMQKFSCMKKWPEQSITSWIGDIKTQAYLLKDIGIDLPDLLTVVVLTSGLPPEYDSVVVVLDAVKPDKLTLELAASHLLNEE